MILTVTSITASALTLLFVALSLRVINMRRSGQGPSVGTNEDEVFLRAVRSHANFSEYTPLFLILLGLYEVQSGDQYILTGSAVIFILGRLLHAIGFGFLGTGPWRTLGMVATNSVLITLAFANIFLVI